MTSLYPISVIVDNVKKRKGNGQILLTLKVYDIAKKRRKKERKLTETKSHMIPDLKDRCFNVSCYNFNLFLNNHSLLFFKEFIHW